MSPLRLALISSAFCVMALLQVLGVGSIGSFMSVAAEPESIESSRYLHQLINGMRFPAMEAFAKGLSAVAIMAFLLAAAYGLIYGVLRPHIGRLGEKLRSSNRLRPDREEGEVSPSLHTGPGLPAGVQARLFPAALTLRRAAPPVFRYPLFGVCSRRHHDSGKQRMNAQSFLELIRNRAQQHLLFLPHAISQMSRADRLISPTDVRQVLFRNPANGTRSSRGGSGHEMHVLWRRFDRKYGPVPS